MNLGKWNRLSVKLIILISCTLVIHLTAYTIYTVTNLRSELREANTRNAYNISDVIKKSTRYSMLLNRNEDVYQIINTIGTEEGVVKIRIYNKQGEISYSTDSTEINSFVNVDDEACYVCHSRADLPVHLPQNEMIREFVNKDGKRVLGLINPISNERDCAGPPCHAHAEDINILGVLDVQLSTAAMDNIVKANTRSIITNSLVLTLLLSAISIYFITVLVKRPIKEISKGIEAISKGNLEYKIPVQKKDELGQMSAEFNNMSAQLNNAYKQIKEWSETLNEKVEQKNSELKEIYAHMTQVEKLASLGKLSATVAHELNNPLEGILTYSKLIAKKLSKQESNRNSKELLVYLDLISSETARCGRIVKDLLLFSNRGDEIFREHKLTDIIEKAISIINHHFELNKLTVSKFYPLQEIRFICDAAKIEQALISIFINAIEAMDEGGTLSINLDESKEEICLRISDTGKGIASEHLHHIFEPFYSTKDEGKGTGLGLSVAYGIIKQHEGALEVEKTSAEGTTFKITFPQNHII